MMDADTRARINAELSHAEAARAAGNPGRSRVCTRRAAGLALSWYFNGRGQAPASVMDLLRAAADLNWLSERSRVAVGRLSHKVDENYTLPPDWDLISEARFLIAELDERA
jgi:hypothetical protein